ncbi:MAG: lysylphosphatidylglycerol synthase transmembrane domain-containing protein [Solirubrobacteraceae bacterium]
MARTLAGSVWFRALVTAALLGWVGARIDWSKMGDRLADGSPGLFVVAVLLVAATLAVGAIRWGRVLVTLDLPASHGRVARMYAISSFTSTFLPTSLGGDVARALMMARRGPRLTRALLSILIDRAAGLAGLLIVAWAGVALERDAVPDSALTALLIATAAAVVVAGVVLLLAFRARGLGRRLPTRVSDILQQAREATLTCLRDRELLVWLLLSSIAFQVLVVLQTVVVADAIGADLPFSTAAVAVALVNVAILMPISVAGFGVREASYVVVLGEAGISATDATLISLISVAALLLASLPGALLLLKRGATQETAASPEQLP